LQSQKIFAIVEGKKGKRTMYQQNAGGNAPENKKYQKNPDECGAIWIKQGKIEYLSISLEIDGVKHGFVAFPNLKRSSENAPNYRVLKSKPKA
jgi:uncharacterized protein (DUF736 family)